MGWGWGGGSGVQLVLFMTLRAMLESKSDSGSGLLPFFFEDLEFPISPAETRIALANDASVNN